MRTSRTPGTSQRNSDASCAHRSLSSNEEMGLALRAAASVLRASALAPSRKSSYLSKSAGSGARRITSIAIASPALPAGAGLQSLSASSKKSGSLDVSATRSPGGAKTRVVATVTCGSLPRRWPRQQKSNSGRARTVPPARRNLSGSRASYRDALGPRLRAGLLECRLALELLEREGTVRPPVN